MLTPPAGSAPALDRMTARQWIQWALCRSWFTGWVEEHSGGRVVELTRRSSRMTVEVVAR